MDHDSHIEQEVHVDLESAEGVSNSNKEGNYVRFISIDDHLCVNEGFEENNVKISMDEKIEVEKYSDFTGKDTRKKCSSAKRPPKPPRPHRGFSLDACDEKLIKELAEVAMIKRARIERMKALMQKKSVKASSSSSSSSSNGTLFALLFTIIFFLVILFQGMSCENSGMAFKGSPQKAQTNENSLVFIQERLNPVAHDSI